MNPLAHVHYPTNTEAELDRLQQMCEQLAGFDERISLEWLDGAMTALAAGPRPLAVAQWRDTLLGDAWTRAFADPEAEREAGAILQARWSILQKQLDPQILLDDPGDLRLAPVMLEWTDEDKARLVEEGHVAAGEEDDEIPQTGEVWAHGFFDAIEAFPAEWPTPDVETDEGQIFDDMTAMVEMLVMPDGEELAKMCEELWPGETVTRDDIIQLALHSVQDLRMFWVENAPKAETRRVGAQPGRNDPCPCGSGKKFKKCHGA